MARKKQVLPIEPSQNEEEDHLDIGSATALLSSEYPLVDNTLIIALLSDYSPLLTNHLDEIRSQLGVIEATLVPDPDYPVGEISDTFNDGSDASSESTISDVAMSDGVDGAAVKERLTRLALNDPAPFAEQPGKSASRKKDAASSSSRPSRTTSTFMSRASDATSPTSVVGSDQEGGFEDDISLLKSLFPSNDVKDLRTALMSESGVPAAIDHLLSLELIRGVERDGHWPDEDQDSLSADEKGEWKQTPPQEKVVKLKSKPIGAAPTPLSSTSRKKSTKTVPLVDTLQRRATPSSSRPTSRASSRPSSRAGSKERAALAGPSSNAWGTVASLSSFLSQLLPDRPATYFLSYLHAPEYHSAYTAVRGALRHLPTKNAANNEASRAILEDLYGVSLSGSAPRALKDDLELCVRIAGDDVATVMDLMDILGEISEWPGDDAFERYDLIDETGWSKKGLRKEMDGWERATTSPSTSVIRLAESDDEWGIPMRDSRLRVSTSDGESEIIKPIVKAAPNPARLTIRPMSKTAPMIERPAVVVGSKAPPSAFASPTVYDNFGSVPDYTPKSSKRDKSKERQVHPQNWRAVDHVRHRPTKVLHPLASSIPSYSRGQTPHNSTPGSLYKSGPSSAEIEEYIANANAERAKRESAIRAAGKHYSSRVSGNKAINGAVAGHYALQAREATEKARGWELKAARAIVGDQLDRSGNTIDLHHLTIHEASTVALESAQSWYESEKAKSYGGVTIQSSTKVNGFAPPRGLTVVTGVGRHSAGQRGVLGPSVANALESAGWRVDRGANGRGYLVVRGRR